MTAVARGVRKRGMEEEPICYAKAPVILEMEPGTYFWCACGRSQSQPFCDGSHKGTRFTPVRLSIKEKSSIGWCMCKRTGKPPYCDGTHKRL